MVASSKVLSLAAGVSAAYNGSVVYEYDTSTLYATSTVVDTIYSCDEGVTSCPYKHAASTAYAIETSVVTAVSTEIDTIYSCEEDVTSCPYRTTSSAAVVPTTEAEVETTSCETEAEIVPSTATVEVPCTTPVSNLTNVTVPVVPKSSAAATTYVTLSQGVTVTVPPVATEPTTVATAVASANGAPMQAAGLSGAVIAIAGLMLM